MRATENAGLENARVSTMDSQNALVYHSARGIAV